VLSVSNDEGDVTDAVLAGACGYVLKESSVEEVIAGVRAAAAGESHFSSALTRPLLRRLHTSIGAPRDLARLRLSAPEQEVLELLAAGDDDDAVPVALGISTSAVRVRASSILTKLVRAAVRASLEAGD